MYPSMRHFPAVGKKNPQGVDKSGRLPLATCNGSWHYATCMDSPPNLSPRDAAALLCVHEDTVKRWAKAGSLKGFRTPGGWWRFRLTDIEEFLDASAVEPVTDDADEVPA